MTSDRCPLPVRIADWLSFLVIAATAVAIGIGAVDIAPSRLFIPATALVAPAVAASGSTCPPPAPPALAADFRNVQ
jgi:hypothetical protein